MKRPNKNNALELNILIGGAAGQGTNSIEKYLLENLREQGYFIFSTKNYMSRIRGGHNYHMLRIAERPVFALKNCRYEIILALDAVAEQWHRPELKKNGFLLDQTKIHQLFGEIKLNKPNEINGIIVGFVLGLLGAAQPADRLLAQGYQISQNSNYFGRFKIAPLNKRTELHTVGKMLALGAIGGGCRFMAGYPMTPSTIVMDNFAAAAKLLPVHFEQAEDEISAINMAIGASYAGARSMVATSGGGLALMQEGISLSAMTETPLVIIEAQRPAPATGLPTRTEQADLNFCLYAGHGEFQRVILAPGALAESLELMQLAFELADQYQLPVFVLTDQYLNDSYQNFEKKTELKPAQRIYGETAAAYQRYALTANNISPLGFPGLGEGLVKVDSDEHDEAGLITEDLQLRTRMVKKRLNKLPNKFFIKPEVYGTKNAKTIVYTWGSNKMILQEALAELNDQGLVLAGVNFAQLYPLDKKILQKIFGQAKKIIGVENNYAGQLAQLLKLHDIKTAAVINKYDGTCFTVEELVTALKKEIKK